MTVTSVSLSDVLQNRAPKTPKNLAFSAASALETDLVSPHLADHEKILFPLITVHFVFCVSQVSNNPVVQFVVSRNSGFWRLIHSNCMKEVFCVCLCMLKW